MGYRVENAFRLLLSTMMLAVVPAAAVELREIEVRTGTEGLEAAPLTVTNRTGEPIACSAQLAHWYSTGLAEIAPAGSATIPLWFDPETGTVTVLNDKAENMPVEALFCGFAGRAYETRALVTLERAAGAAPGARSIACGEDGARLACRP